MSRTIRVTILGDASKLDRAFRSASRSANSFEARTKRLGGNLARNLGLGAISITALGAASVKAGAQYGDTMQKIVGLSGVAQGSVDKFSQQVLNLAPKVAKSPQELAEALYFITSSGIAAADSMDVLTQVSKASAAGLGETQTVADAVTSAMNAYGPSVVTAKDATDVLVATVREGKGEASEFAGVIGNVAAVAAQLGVSFNDVGAALAGETRLGIDPETSATQLSAFFSSILKTSPAAEKALNKFGISSAGLRKELKEKGLIETLQTIKLAFGDNTSAMAKAFPNVRSLRGILALVGKQGSSTAAIFERMRNSTGSLGKAFGAVSHDGQFKLNQLSASLRVLQIRIGTALLPIVVKYGGQLSRWLSKSENQRKITMAVAHAARVLGTAVGVAVGVVRRAVHVAQMFSTAVGGWKNAARIVLTGYLAIKLIGVATALRKTAVAWGLLNTQAKGGALKGGAARAKGLSKAWGKVGVAGAVVLAGYVLSRFIRKLPGWEGAMKSFGGKIADVAAKFGLISGGGKTGFEGLGPKQSHAAMSAMRTTAARLEGQGLSPEKAADALQRKFPGFTRHDVEVAAGVGVGGVKVRSGQTAFTQAEHASVGGKAAPKTGSSIATPDKPHKTGDDKPKGPKSLKDVVPLAIQLEIARARTVKAKRIALNAELVALNRELAGRLTKADRISAESEKSSVLSELDGMDQAVASKKKAAHQKELAREKKHHERLASAHKKAVAKAKAAAEKAAQVMADAVSSAREGLGDLFGGPVLNPTEDKNKGILGVSNAGARVNVGTLTADLNAQVAQSRRLQKGLATLKRRGASKQLLGELGAKGVEGLPQIEALASASGPALKAFEKAFGAREKQVRKIAVMHVTAARVNIKASKADGIHKKEADTVIKIPIHLDGKKIAESTTRHQQRRAKTTATQRRGRNGGV